MPSGKKKRKAVRKKKELEAHLDNGSLCDSNEYKDLSSQDEEDSGHDGNGDVGLPASHGCHQTFTGESEEPAKNDAFSVLTTADGNKSVEPAKNDAFSVLTTADGNKSVEVPQLKEEESSCGNGDVETLEGPVSNDDTLTGTELLKETPEDEESSKVLGMGTTQVEGFIQITDPLPQEVSENLDSMKLIAQNSKDMSLVAPPSSAATDTEQLKNSADSEMILGSERTLVNVVSPASGFDSGSMKFGVKVYPVSMDSSIPDPDSKKKDPKLLQSPDSANFEANDGLKLPEDIHVAEFSEKQPLVAPVPRVAERTSWMNCCGILDLFSGSSR